MPLRTLVDWLLSDINPRPFAFHRTEPPNPLRTDADAGQLKRPSGKSDFGFPFEGLNGGPHGRLPQGYGRDREAHA